jgi:hypothetical protein
VLEDETDDKEEEISTPTMVELIVDASRVGISIDELI